MSIKNYLVSLKTARNWAVVQKLLPTMPSFPTIHVPKKKPQPVPSESFERLLEKVPDDLWRAYLLCSWWGGLRLSEALFWEWEPSEEQRGLISTTIALRQAVREAFHRFAALRRVNVRLTR